MKAKTSGKIEFKEHSYKKMRVGDYQLTLNDDQLDIRLLSRRGDGTRVDGLYYIVYSGKLSEFIELTSHVQFGLIDEVGPPNEFHYVKEDGVISYSTLDPKRPTFFAVAFLSMIVGALVFWCIAQIPGVNLL